MTTAEIRRAFQEYFRRQGHTPVQSSSLIPGDDPTLLFVNAGMVQFKDCFLGADVRDYKRATTCQKCLRISGKHNDLENVGRTARHHTFFEMLGNFSFGDYFKNDAILFAWEFLTKELGLPKNRLWVTIYEEDDEAGKLWSELTDVLPGRILKCGKDDNFWAMGETGPCGPCTEIHYFLGDEATPQSEADFRKGDGTYVEIWNLVFMQYNRDITGKLTPLPKPSVDTGMGLERIAAVKQGFQANYDIDLLRAIISSVEKLSGKRYDGRDYTPVETEQYLHDVAFRVAADHVRAAMFLIADGVTPSSDGRGYVLRRLIRRACRHGRVLGFTEPFLYRLATAAIGLMGEAYPELLSSQGSIERMIRAEEEKFLQTLDTGLAVLKKESEGIKKRGTKTLPGDVAFLLHDTYGFPLDLTEDIARGDGLGVDLPGFERAMEEQRSRSRSVRASESAQILQRSVTVTPSKFVGYGFTEYESRVSGLFSANGAQKVAKAGDEIALVVDETPFYAESGGQLGDTGSIASNGGVLEVVDTQKAAGDTLVHICRVVEGELGLGERVRLKVEEGRRKKLAANHSATHIVHLMLREIVGDHVKQAGSRVSDETLRFDYSHFESLAPEQLTQIELLANEYIRGDFEVRTDILPLEEAKRSGAMALFGEKYGSAVRVVTIGPRSKELCGGTHVSRSGEIGSLSILAEGGVSAGVRRIECVAGGSAAAEMLRQKKLLREITSTLKSGEGELLSRLERLLERNRELERELERVGSKMKAQEGSALGANPERSPSGVSFVAANVKDASPKDLREMADQLRGKLGSGVIALCSVVDGKAIVLTAVTDDLQGKIHAGKLVSEMSVTLGGKGGGRPDLAQAGGGDPSQIPAALERLRELIP